MTATEAIAPATYARSPRSAALLAIRAVSVVVGAAALLVGGGYFVIAALGPQVWYFSGGSAGTGAMVNFPLALRLVNAGAILLWCATVAAMAFIVSALARAVRVEVRFARAVSRAAWALAIALLVGSTAAQIVQNIAASSGLVIGNGVDPSSPLGAPIGWGISPEVFVPNLAFLGLSVVIGLLAFIIGSAERLQQDNEGLI